jgi:hypothetical protein
MMYKSSAARCKYDPLQGPTLVKTNASEHRPAITCRLSILAIDTNSDMVLPW